MSPRMRLPAALAQGIDGLPAGVVFSLALASVAVIGAADEVGGADVHLAPLYVAPVAFAAWFLGRAGGLALAAAASVAWWAGERAIRARAAPGAAQALDVALELAMLASVALLVAALRRLLARDAVRERTDDLTGLLNRHGFLEVARREMARAARTGRPLTVAVLDVDRFREVSDTRGPEAAEQLVVAAAGGLRTSLRAVDACARVSGSEFAVLLPDTDGASGELVIDRLRMVVAQAAAEHGSPSTTSVGAVTFERPPASLDELLRAALRVLREVKAAGRDGVRHERVPATVETAAT